MTAALSIDTTAAPGVGVSLRGLARRFGERFVLRDLDLDLAAGSFTAVVGRSGCGKSTLLRLLAGLDQPDDGQLRFDDPAAQARLMYQDARLLPWATIAANVEIGLGARRKSAEGQRNVLEALAAVGLQGRESDWPAVLSGGQKQRAALARALVSAPRFLALDEPFGALDALTRMEMQDLLQRVWRDQGFTALLVTHDIGEALVLADRVILLEQGRIALDLTITVPRGQRRGHPELAALEAQVLRQLGIISDAPAPTP